MFRPSGPLGGLDAVLWWLSFRKGAGQDASRNCRDFPCGWGLNKPQIIHMFGCSPKKTIHKNLGYPINWKPPYRDSCCYAMTIPYCDGYILGIKRWFLKKIWIEDVMRGIRKICAELHCFFKNVWRVSTFDGSRIVGDESHSDHAINHPQWSTVK